AWRGSSTGCWRRFPADPRARRALRHMPRGPGCCSIIRLRASAHRRAPSACGVTSRRNAMLQLDAVQTLALAGIALFLGYALCRTIPVLGRYNLPPPVIGALVFAIAAWIAHDRGTTLF